MDVGSMRSLFPEKVDVKDVSRLEQKLGECATWESVRNVFKEMYTCIRREEFD